MAENGKHLDRAYNLGGAAETQSFYDEWADTYDAEVAENGYVTPARCARALAQHAPDMTAPLMDLGCGTGISGQGFAEAGFTTIDGCDFSAEMLAKAGTKGIYRDLLQADLSNPIPFDDGAYPSIAAIGVLVPGHAPASLVDDVMSKLPRNGLFVFSLNDHALADGSYEGRVRDQLDTGAALLLFREHGDHLPNIGMKSTVYVLQKIR